jgi:hypothetical protein
MQKEGNQQSTKALQPPARTATCSARANAMHECGVVCMCGLQESVGESEDGVCALSHARVDLQRYACESRLLLRPMNG